LVPYLGLWLTDLTFIDDGNPKVCDDGLFNFEKAEMVARRLLDFRDCISVQYTMPSNAGKI